MTVRRMDREVFDRNCYVARLLRLLSAGLRHLVDELLGKKGQTVYLCQLCGFAYADLETGRTLRIVLPRGIVFLAEIKTEGYTQAVNPSPRID
jgi:hypothetical protein